MLKSLIAWWNGTRSIEQTGDAAVVTRTRQATECRASLDLPRSYAPASFSLFLVSPCQERRGGAQQNRLALVYISRHARILSSSLPHSVLVTHSDPPQRTELREVRPQMKKKKRKKGGSITGVIRRPPPLSMIQHNARLVNYWIVLYSQYIGYPTLLILVNYLLPIVALVPLSLCYERNQPPSYYNLRVLFLWREKENVEWNLCVQTRC